MGIETLAAISLATTVAGTAASAIGQSKQYDATSNEAQYRGQVAENNRIIAEQNARYATQAAATNAQSRDFYTRGLLGQARTATAAGGIDPTTGSPAAVQGSIQQVGRLSSLEDIQKGILEAYSQKQQAAGYGAEAGLQRYKASSAQEAKGTALVGTILGGASSVAGKWASFQNQGIDIFGTKKDPWSFGGTLVA